MSPHWELARRIAIAVLTALACAVVLTASFAAFGGLGLVIAADTLALLALLIVLAGAPRPASAPPPHRRQARRWTGGARGRTGRLGPGWLPLNLSWAWRAPAGTHASGFPAYRRISTALGWATVSRRHYDHATRPLLTRLLRARAAERGLIGPDRPPEELRHLIGEDLWPLIDPLRAPSTAGDGPGVDLAALTRFVERLEQL